MIYNYNDYLNSYLSNFKPDLQVLKNNAHVVKYSRTT